ncbi:multi antimicrobial extrusion protein [Artemisia annua]|uniref:Multi antimicrobial extrusion protein n=1 Tax=Artemisia annua TaxID=35608 RepID=A0A2U1PGV0_ARTAN|nr:multi antimicrobial extrusion protein [Artemisia annua]
MGRFAHRFNIIATTIHIRDSNPKINRAARGVALGCGWQSRVAMVNFGLWAGMLSGTVVQTLILAIIIIRCEGDKQIKPKSSRLAHFNGSINVDSCSQAKEAYAPVVKRAVSR